MTKLSPKAARYVADAVRGLPERDQAVWTRIDPAKELPAEAAQIALGALERVERQLRMRLDTEPLGEDATSDLSNDLGFVRAIESDLRRMI
jgi:hypothetical protein